MGSAPDNAPSAPEVSSATLYQESAHVRVRSETRLGMIACSTVNPALRSVRMPFSMQTNASGISVDTGFAQASANAPDEDAKAQMSRPRRRPNRSLNRVAAAVAAAFPKSPEARRDPIALGLKPIRDR